MLIMICTIGSFILIVCIAALCFNIKHYNDEEDNNL